MTGSTAVSLIVIIHTKRFLPSNSQISLVFQTFCSFKEWKKSDFLWAPVWGPKTTAKTGLATEGLPSSRACADIHACRAWRTIARGAAKSWKPSGMQNLSRTRRNNRNLHYFLPGGKKFADKTTPVLGSVFGPQNGGQVARTQANQIETE